MTIAWKISNGAVKHITIITVAELESKPDH